MRRFINYGIDLGTTNSCIARWDGDDVRVFMSNDQKLTTPSAVHISKTGRMLVGQRACAQLTRDEENVAREFKRLMGLKDNVAFPASGKSMSPEELSAEVLKSMCEDVRRLTGEEVTSAVITVPAAFTTAQCEATARAAALAGLVEAPLLQEPIAAAIAYGATPDAGDQRWLVFDLGGGTLDIAIISTRNGRLTVLDHRGDNLLGGKDIDRRIVEEFIYPAIEATGKYSLPDPSAGGPAYRSLRNRLSLCAEEAKIDLRAYEDVTLEIIDVGEDLVGETIELERLVLRRRDLEQRVLKDVMERCISIGNDALEGARLKPGNLSRVLLVGGPTQTPYIRAALAQWLGVPLEFSIDPMTVVARGAAIYASTLEKTDGADVPFSRPGAVTVKLSYEAISSKESENVLGKIEDSEGIEVAEIQVEAASGIWTSGWAPSEKGFFEVSVPLTPGKPSTFRISARDRSGRILPVTPDEFVIRNGLILDSPPIPHSISVEIIEGGTPRLDTVFNKGTTLPAKRVVTYHADHTIRPSEPDGYIAIKLYEGETFSDPTANSIVGVLTIKATDVPRPVAEGAEIELTVEIDTSRLIKVTAFIPSLNFFVERGIYLPERDKEDVLAEAQRVAENMDALVERVEKMDTFVTSTDASVPYEEIERLQREVEDLDLLIARQENGDDQDEAQRVVQKSRDVRQRLAKIEVLAGATVDEVAATEEANEWLDRTRRVVEEHGAPLDKGELSEIERALMKAKERQDLRGIKKATDRLLTVHYRVASAQPGFWMAWLEYMSRPEQDFTRPSEARRWIAVGRKAIDESDLDALSQAVRNLWKLMPGDEQESDQERVMRAGLRL